MAVQHACATPLTLPALKGTLHLADAPMGRFAVLGQANIMSVFADEWKLWVGAAALAVPVFLGIAWMFLAVVRAFKDVYLSDSTAAKSPQKPKYAVVRHEEVVKLTPEQQARKRQGEQLIAEGRVLEGARLLEEVTFHRSAIDALEKAGHIDEACAVLMRLQRPNRAGVLCQRNGQPLQAAKYFLLADLPEDAGKCFLEAARGNFRYLSRAGEAFEKAGQHAQALNAFGEMLNTPKVLELVRQSSEYLFLAHYMHGPRTTREVLGQLSPQEQKSLVGALPLTPHSVQRTLDWLAISATEELAMQAVDHFLPDPWLSGKLWSALPAAEERIARLLAQPNADPRRIEHIADGLTEWKSHQAAARLFEHAGVWPKAALAWVLAGDLPRCAQALQKGGHTNELTAIRQLMTHAHQHDTVNGTIPPEVQKALWEKIRAILQPLVGHPTAPLSEVRAA